MAGITLQNNLLALNADRMLGFNAAQKAKSTEKLSSGYRINRAADDAAGLAISEKMRKMIRGLDQGTHNAQDGVSWVQTGDGALEEAQEMIKRMSELTIKSLNGTNSSSDRAAMQSEFEQLKVELDRIGTTTKFNELDIFSEHKPLWYQCDGAVKWEPNQMHVVTAGQNDLTFTYRDSDEGPLRTMSITVPPGEYSTLELMDEIDSALSFSMGNSTRLFMQYNKDGYINTTLEGGTIIETISGGLSYLMYDMYKGGHMGALIGTTIFPDETAKLEIFAGKNDSMTFMVEHYDGRAEQKALQIPAGKYTREQLIQQINAQLAGSSVGASAYGTGIKLAATDGIVTGFKGNMFRIDGADYTSVFYDNVHYGSVHQYSAVFQGGYVLNTDARDEEHKKLEITDTNNVLTLQPNGRDTPIDLVIDKGSYTMDEMADKLNLLFNQNALGLKAEITTASVHVGDKSVQFKGLKITSTIAGPESMVNIDKTSSAYHTLFVDRNYNEYGSKATITNESTKNKDAWYMGSRQLNAPITLGPGNDSFQITMKETGSAQTTVTLRLTNKKYTSISDLITELNNQIAANSTLNGKLTARIDNGMIRISGAAGQDIDSIAVGAFTDASGTVNKGFDSLFQGYRTTITDNVNSGTGSIILGGSINSNSMVVTVDGTSYTVHFPVTNPTQDQIKNAIESTIKAHEVTTNNTFNTVSGTGSSNDRNFNAYNQGSATIKQWNDSAVGSSKKIEGMVGFEYNNPAVLKLGVELKDPMVVGAGNNELTLTLNGTTKVLKLSNGSYSPQSLAAELQKKIDEAFGTGMGGAVVSRSGNVLTLTSRLPAGEDGKDTSISCGTNTSNFLSHLNTTENPAVCTSNLALAPSIVIKPGSDKFTFQYTENGRTQNVQLTLAPGTYTPSTIVTQIQQQLNKTGTGIQASLSPNGQLTLTSSAKGNGVAIEYHTKTAGSAISALYGDLTGEYPANIVVNRNIQQPITIEAGKQDFSITVNGIKQTVTLDAGTYNTREDFLAMLNGKLGTVGAEAYLSGDRLGFRTLAKGSGESIMMEYSAGGSSMKAIYGTTTTMIPGVKAEWVNNQLKLTAVDIYGNPMNKVVSVSSASSGGLQPPTVEVDPIATRAESGYHSRIYSAVDGVNLGTPIVIDQWNNELKFTYTENGIAADVPITLDDNTYTYDSLKKALQDKIDAKLGSGKVQVEVNGNGVVLSATKYGSEYKFGNLSGDFYQNVMCQCTEKKSQQNIVADADGYQTVDKPYIVGRKDIKSQITEINKGVNDELSLDLTWDGNVHTIRVTIDQGRYNSDMLKAHLQEKIDKELVSMGMNAGLIQVGVGGISSGVAGGNDQKALNFSLAADIPSPGSGDFIIDGISGSAAFDVFYQTDGKMVPAYIMGTKDVTNGVTVKPGETELSVCVDGKVYSIELEEGPYTADEIIDAMNERFKGVHAPIAAYVDIDTGRIKISHKMPDAHEISWVSGSAKDELFFVESGDFEETDRRIQLSDENPDYIGLMRSEFSTSLIGINSLCITKIKYATKAVDRLAGALEKVSTLRSIFGSTQNRLEHSINNNRNTSENLQSADSAIRDTDMAKEMVRQSSLHILQQAGMSMLSQANQTNQGVMELLG